jgi:hypothetical protein
MRTGSGRLFFWLTLVPRLRPKHLRINGKDSVKNTALGVASLPREIQGFFPFGFAQGQNDGKNKNNKSRSDKNSTAITKAEATKTEADPYGMTNKKGKGKGKSNSKYKSRSPAGMTNKKSSGKSNCCWVECISFPPFAKARRMGHRHRRSAGTWTIDNKRP